MEDNIMSLLDVLENASCGDPFECPFDMYGKNGDGKYGCFAKFPNGDPNEEDHGCIAHQAAQIIKEIKVSLDLLKEQKGKWIEYPECLKYDGANSDDYIVCSACKHVFNIIDNCTEEFDYCPHCGAKMDS